MYIFNLLEGPYLPLFIYPIEERGANLPERIRSKNPLELGRIDRKLTSCLVACLQSSSHGENKSPHSISNDGRPEKFLFSGAFESVFPGTETGLF
jgi:hypothetical protein